MKETKTHHLLIGMLLALALLDLAVVTYLLLPPSVQERTGQARSAAAAELPQADEQRLSAGLPQAEQPEEAAAPDTAPVEEQDVPEEPEIVEKEKPEGERSATEILADARLVAHGMGYIDGFATLNCLEGFLLQYEAGVRVFEADLRLTRDGCIVLRHDWWPDDWQDGIDWAHIPTREKFVSEKILDRYTPLSFRDLLLLMEQYPDICIITDTKFTESDIFTLQFDAMLADAKELGLTYLFDRIAIQVYSGNMHTAVHNIYPFPHYIYSLYQDEDPFWGSESDFRSRVAYCKEKGIEGITIEVEKWKNVHASIAEEYGIKFYVHTVNSASSAQKLLDAGVSAVYSDSLVPGDLS